MNPVEKSSAPYRRFIRWVLIGVGLCVLPFVILGIVAVSYLLPDREVRTLREQVVAATDSDWSTKMQFSLGRTTIDAVRLGLGFFHHENIPDARLALASLRNASVGIYERDTGASTWSQKRLLADTDRAMSKRGWIRLAGVIDQNDTVLVYVPQDMGSANLMEVCLAVVNGKELVVVSTKLDASALDELLKLQLAKNFKDRTLLALR